MKCICQMCACGKHRCPHFVVEKKSAVTNKEPCKVTEYRGEFKAGTAPGQITLHKPSDCIKQEGSVNFDTTHQRTYPAHAIETLSPRKKKAEVKVVVNNQPMQGDTEYGHRYANGTTTEIPAPPEYLKKKTQPFSCGDGGPLDTSVTQQDYDVKKAVEKPLLIKLKDNHVPVCVPFNAKSVNHTDFTKFNEPPRPSERQPDNITSKGQPRYFDTTTRSHYTKHEQQPVFQKGPRDVYEPSTQPFEGNSIMKADYGAHESPIKSSPVKHDNHLFASNEPMPNKTTNSAMYQSWGIQKPASLRETSVYRPPSKDMDMQKTSDDYKNFGPPQPSKSLRPKTNIICGGEFDGTTVYTDRFVKHDVNPRLKPIVSRENTYQPSSVPFEGCSENKDHYKKHHSSPAKMVRRVNEVFEKNATFDAHTSYSADYASKKLPLCPIAKGISTNFKGYRMVENGDGHRCLQKTGSDSNSNSSVSASPLPPISESKAASLVAVN